ncbi:hypothetical protein CVT26_012765 [Gymnopilus dilepis]|uniref:Uncharacterized protein n=1 Tax=Gymnopilus dilepis TaxID=231916 RepID=A0A409YVT4_9AGAR|nr:hypothetical protein CVT26_012765 [Gymnopilus dilepis]
MAKEASMKLDSKFEGLRHGSTGRVVRTHWVRQHRFIGENAVERGRESLYRRDEKATCLNGRKNAPTLEKGGVKPKAVK